MAYNFSEFFSICKDIYSSRKDEIEEYRAKLIKKYHKSLCIVFITCPLCIYILAIFAIKVHNIDNFLYLLGIVILILILSFALYIILYSKYEYQLKYKRRMKNIFMNDLLSYFGDIRWSRTLSNTISKELIIKSNAFKPFSSVLFDDIFKGYIKDVEVFFAETKLSEYEYTENNPLRYHQQWHPDINYYEMAKNCSFKGLVIFFKFKKEVKTSIIINSNKNIFQRMAKFFLFDNILRCIFIGFAIIYSFYVIKYEIKLLPTLIPIICMCVFLFWNSYSPNKNNLSKVNLEDGKFNKQFDVYSSDQIEVRYILTPLFMNLLNDFKTVFFAKDIKCSFFDDRFMIAIENKKNLFEIGDLFSPLNPKYMKNLYDEISLICKIIEYFKLNKNILFQ